MAAERVKEAPTAEQVRAVVARELGVDAEDCVDTATLSQLGADSLDFVEILISVERHFNIDITDDDGDRCRTVGDLIALVERLRGEVAGG